MDRGAVVRQLVHYGDLDSITSVCLDNRSWHLTVDGQCKLGACAIVNQGGVRDLEIVLARDTGVVRCIIVVAADALPIALYRTICRRVANVIGRVDGRTVCWATCGARGGGS